MSFWPHKLHDHIAIAMKLCPSWQSFLRSIFRWKAHTSVASVHEQMTHFGTCSHFTDHFSSYRHTVALKICKLCLLDQRSWLMTSFFIFDNINNLFLVCKLHIVKWLSKWWHQLSSFHEDYPWWKFQLHTIPGTWGTRARAPHPPPCMHHPILEKRCMLKG